MAQPVHDLEESQLSAFGMDLLSFERSWWSHGGGEKDHGIRERFNLSPAQYYQHLNALLDDPDALAFDPLLVKRLRRLRDQRRRARSAARLGVHVQ